MKKLLFVAMSVVVALAGSFFDQSYVWATPKSFGSACLFQD